MNANSDYLNCGLSQPHSSFSICLLCSGSFSDAHYDQHQRESRGNERRWNSNESILPLVSSSAYKYTRQEEAAALPWVSVLLAILVPCAARQYRVGCMEMICGMKESGELAPTVAFSKKRHRNYMLSSSVQQTVVQILLNKLLFGSTLAHQKQKKRERDHL